MSHIIGIDLGTTNSGVAVWLDDKPFLIPDKDGYRLTPSVIALDPEKNIWVVGHKARDVAEYHPDQAVYSIKRFIGRRFESDIIQHDLDDLRVLYTVVASQRTEGMEVVLDDRKWTPQQISAKVLKKLRDDAEAFLDETVEEAVITVPAYFHESQRQATRDAGRLAGLDVKRVVNEPTAASLAFAYDRLAAERHTIAVFDFGGGTFDISILDVGRGPFRVRATNGDTHLGGDDIDWAIIEWVYSKLSSAEARQVASDHFALARLRKAAEEAKIELTDKETTELVVPGRLGQQAAIMDLTIELTRVQLNVLAEPIIQKVLAPCAQVIKDAKIGVEDIQEVLMVGGPTRMPALREAVRGFFGDKLNTDVVPEEVVALGASVQGAILAGLQTGIRLSDVVPLSLGVGTQDGRMDTMIKRNSHVPILETRHYSTVVDNQDRIEISVYQGEWPTIENNVFLNKFILGGIQPAKKGEPDIAVTFDVDEDGILRVTGKDMVTGTEKEITITDSVRLSESEIAQMIADVEGLESESVE